MGEIVEIANSPKSALAKTRNRVRLELVGRPYLEGLPISISDLGLHLYLRSKGGVSQTHALAFADIEAVWDLSAGTCVWRKP